MDQLLGAITALSASMILFVTGARHLIHLPAFRRQLRAQRLWPRFIELPLAVGLGLFELGLGSAGLVLLWRLPADADSLRLALIASSVLCFAFAGLMIVLLRTRSGAPCACDGREHAASVWGMARAVTMAAGALYASGEVRSIGALGVWHWRTGVIIAAAGSFALIVWNYPAAMRNIGAELHSSRFASAARA